ncbi:hypothetical protein ACJX0J_027848, partial [Zea mays]
LGCMQFNLNDVEHEIKIVVFIPIVQKNALAVAAFLELDNRWNQRQPKTEKYFILKTLKSITKTIKQKNASEMHTAILSYLSPKVYLKKHHVFQQEVIKYA